ncbi:uncharacterized protein LOC133736866 [Rosa rugosa]|uniref:uncharacterized protein LOC133736866 n=1 Tax=Rosa rugosa TaxID=74645 RepID=UPI002B405E5D|nr:uncharacterized protein LOC133736866 [Rosa rugosa]
MADEIEAFKFVDLDILLSICERISTLVLMLICPDFKAVGTFLMIATFLRLQYLVFYRLSAIMPELLDYCIAVFADRMITVVQMFLGWPSVWYIVIMVGLGMVSTICTACNMYSMYSITQKQKAEIEEKRLLAIEAIKAGAANSAELFDFVVYHSDYYRNYLNYYSGETAYELSYTRIREDLLADQLV